MVMIMKVNRNKGIYPDFSRNVSDVCRDDNYEMPLVYLAINLTP